MGTSKIVFDEYLRKSLRYLLLEKYNWTESAINDFLLSIDSKMVSIDKSIRNDCQRLMDGEPLAYVIGWVDFLDCRIQLNSSVLIPRPETEFWVSPFITNRDGSESGRFRIGTVPNPKLLDLCCGSGCIGISVLKKLSNADVTFADISLEALETTQKNLETNKMHSNSYKIIHTDLFKNINDKYDYILCNPPYVSTFEDNPDLNWEPSLALYADKEGLSLIEKIINIAPNYLNPSGTLYLEFGKGQENKIQEFLRKSDLTSFKFYKDQYGVVRYFVAKKAEVHK